MKVKTWRDCLSERTVRVASSRLQGKGGGLASPPNRTATPASRAAPVAGAATAATARVDHDPLLLGFDWGSVEPVAETAAD